LLNRFRVKLSLNRCPGAGDLLQALRVDDLIGCLPDASVGEVLGDAVTPEVAAAWGEVY
jgi:hypothetical protein